MNIEITNVALAPNYFARFSPKLQSEIAETCAMSSDHLFLITRAAYANRGRTVFRYLTRNRKRINNGAARRMGEIVACGQYTDARACFKMEDVLPGPIRHGEVFPINVKRSAQKAAVMT